MSETTGFGTAEPRELVLVRRLMMWWGAVNAGLTVVWLLVVGLLSGASTSLGASGVAGYLIGLALWGAIFELGRRLKPGARRLLDAALLLQLVVVALVVEQFVGGLPTVSGVANLALAGIILSLGWRVRGSESKPTSQA